MPLLGGEKSSGPSHDGEGWQGTIIPLSAMEGGGGVVQALHVNHSREAVAAV